MVVSFIDCIEAFRKWKCPSCGGKGEYEKHGRGTRLRATGLPVSSHPLNEIVKCKICDGNGLHPTASKIIEKLEEQLK